MASDEDLQEVFQRWLDSDVKVRLVAFYRNNPGLVDTIPGLARRLGTREDAVRDMVEDPVELGILRKQTVGDRTVLVYDRQRDQELRERITSGLRGLEGDT